MSDIELSFCIPVMNRLSDLQATLRKNLDDNRNDLQSIEFIVVCFDKDDQTSKWVSDHFAEELASGYLRFYKSDQLESWHFGRAKNAFRGLIRGRIYASLDGDNYTGPSGGRHIIDVFKNNDYGCVFHQFQGDWGDGTCGRVSMTIDDYKSIGYDDHLLPRQWDELDALLSILAHHPSRRYVCYQGKSIIKKSHPFRRFLEENSISPVVVEIDDKSDPLYGYVGTQAVGRHNSNYVQDDPKLRYSSIFNHLSSFFKNTHLDARRNAYVQELVEIQRKMVEEIDSRVLEKWFLARQDANQLLIDTDDIVLVSCLKDEPGLYEWVQYYRALGVTRFLLVDDHSKHPIREQLNAEDVYVWRPVTGKFRYSKVFWFEVLLSSYCRGNWCLTVDSDEYLSLPSFPLERVDTQSVLRRFIDVGVSKGRTYFCGFMLDLIPSKACFPRMQNLTLLQRSDFTNYQYRPSTLTHGYKKSGTTRWSYGGNIDWAYRIDIRYRLNRSFDSLRKFPILRYQPGVHLNQGFHDLIIGGEKRSADELKRTDLVPVLHYKLHALVAGTMVGLEKDPDAYHHETRENLIRLRSDYNRKMIHAALSPYSFSYLDYGLIPTPSIQQLRIRPKATAKDVPDEWCVERNGELEFIESTSDVGARGVFVFGKTLAEAAEWIARNTPYRIIVEKRDDCIVLAS